MDAAAITTRSRSLVPPVLTCALVSAAAMVWLMPGIALGWEPGASPWRLLTCQLAHWDGNQLLWDALAVLILGSWAEGCWPGRSRLGLVLALALIPLSVVVVHPGLAFRGLSGIACMFATVAAIGTWREGRRDGDATAATVALLLLALMLGKIAYETSTGDAVFATAAGWWPVPLAHAVGALAGWLACTLPSIKDGT